MLRAWVVVVVVVVGHATQGAQARTNADITNALLQNRLPSPAFGGGRAHNHNHNHNHNGPPTRVPDASLAALQGSSVATRPAAPKSAFQVMLVRVAGRIIQMIIRMVIMIIKANIKNKIKSITMALKFMSLAGGTPMMNSEVPPDPGQWPLPPPRPDLGVRDKPPRWYLQPPVWWTTMPPWWVSPSGLGSPSPNMVAGPGAQANGDADTDGGTDTDAGTDTDVEVGGAVEHEDNDTGTDQEGNGQTDAETDAGTDAGTEPEPPALLQVDEVDEDDGPRTVRDGQCPDATAEVRALQRRLHAQSKQVAALEDEVLDMAAWVSDQFATAVAALEARGAIDDDHPPTHNATTTTATTPACEGQQA